MEYPKYLIVSSENYCIGVVSGGLGRGLSLPV